MAGSSPCSCCLNAAWRHLLILFQVYQGLFFFKLTNHFLTPHILRQTAPTCFEKKKRIFLSNSAMSTPVQLEIELLQPRIRQGSKPTTADADKQSRFGKFLVVCLLWQWGEISTQPAPLGSVFWNKSCVLSGARQQILPVPAVCHASPLAAVLRLALLPLFF